ncbi:sugar transferase [Engelhardtia mirabilis]|uniref:UDP-N-acetylgalactosamine-undecaprenyl-phosphate N-acetylgalactosaminephosphotransferase n=1 Tax=Engelhardtia mirabilis TaxID=2528011 RepID=A0A518BJI2_9BACT|nr:UDP-N-acetylgalactosamine-undecaprenyl-phosphate N-acetylgalactosaminephosphotransferase [Planctomycetes bacterium Pla133]QDV01455.1 UDP-N-acetylgalactosamine-undecaprenyl-phosphate N-acetylgalactosaminephosphotransferase [Planctomycetes bacterium Pla86]
MIERVTYPPLRPSGERQTKRVERPSIEPRPALPQESLPGTSVAALMANATAPDAPSWELPGNFYARRGKRLFDLAVLVLTAPLALALAVPIALVNLCLFRRPSEILFAQTRVGHRGCEFRIYKFRTMRESRSGSYHSWHSGDDRLRVTRFGKLLRNSHLDELPQLINVLLGDMSLIGPRPEMVEIETWAEEAVPGFAQRLVAKPGITGYAQVQQGYTGRCVEAYCEKLELSAEYVRRLSLGLDLWIVWRTAVTMLKLDGWRWHEKMTGTAAEREAARRPTPNSVWN